MDDTGAFARMLASLRTSFNGRLPAGLTQTADKRLQRTLQHYIREVVRVQGKLQENEVLRETFDSMASWFRRNTQQILPQTATAPPPPIEHAVAPDIVPGGGGLANIGGSPWWEEEDSAKALERIRAVRGSSGTEAPVTLSTDLASLMGGAAAAAEASLTTGVQQKDFIQRQESIVKYRDVEYNLILNSKDRDWLHSLGEQNRYRFSVIPDNTRPQGASTQLLLMKQFRNITRLEFVKAILPVEALDMTVPLKPAAPSAVAAPELAFSSVLSQPFINVICDEHVGNNIGTNDSIDRSLAICQYDATWRSDFQAGEARLNRGYTLFFPKFMKAHRLYQPTPLASFQKLTFEILNPENQPLSRLPDSSHVAQIAFSNKVPTNGAGSPDAAGTSEYLDANGSYVFIRTRQWFPMWSYSKIDKITFAGLTFTDASANTQTAGNALLEWLQSADGHLVVGTAWSDPIDNTIINDGANECGYSNWIIIRNRVTTPATDGTFDGTCTLQTFSGGANDDALRDALACYPTGYQYGGVLNLSRQVQIVLRVICRELDPATNIRPDNA